VDVELTDRDFALSVLGSLDYEAQLGAIRGLLERHRDADEQLCCDDHEDRPSSAPASWNDERACRGDPMIQWVRAYLLEDRRWDCRFAHGGANPTRGAEDLVRGVIELVDEVWLRALLPSDLDRTLRALFAYRNKMFHCGFEWPKNERRRFDERCGRDWPVDWKL
jgi:hypothetical protein